MEHPKSKSESQTTIVTLYMNYGNHAGSRQRPLLGPQHGRRGRELARELGKVVGRQILVGHVVVAILARR